MAGKKGMKWKKEKKFCHQVYTNLDSETMKYVKEISKKKNWSISQTIRNMLKEFILFNIKDL